MRLKQRITDALLPVLKEICFRCEVNDIGFFGSAADIACPLPAKYGLDMDEGTVYNIKNGVSVDGFPLFSSARLSAGFLELDISDGALGRFAAEVISGADEAAFIPADEFELKKGLEFVRARLLDIYRQKGGGFKIPADPDSRRALWHCLTADSPSSLNKAVKESGDAAMRDRLSRFSGSEKYDLSGGAALAMAVSLYKASKTEPLDRSN